MIPQRSKKFPLKLVLRQHRIDEYRASQNVQGKARAAGNGCSLVKARNAALDALGSSLRASREVIIHGVAPLGKGLSFPARRALWLIASRLAVSINPILTEYRGETKIFLIPRETNILHSAIRGEVTNSGINLTPDLLHNDDTKTPEAFLISRRVERMDA